LEEKYMRYRGIVLSTALIALFNYGCVKPTDSRGVNQKEQSSDGGQVYNEQQIKFHMMRLRRPIKSDSTG